MPNLAPPAADSKNPAAAAAAAGEAPLQAAAAQAAAPVSKFWEDLAHATYHSPTKANYDCGKVVLAAQSHWLGLIENGHHLLERPCYRSLWSEVQAGWSETPRKSTLIIGTPGIGKSMLLSYALWALVRAHLEAVSSKSQPKPKPLVIVLEQRKDSTRMLFQVDAGGKAQPVLIGAKLSFEDELYNEHTYYLCDSTNPSSSNARRLVVSSPNPELYRQYAKDAVTRYMPLWTDDELALARPLLFSELSDQEVQQRVLLVGRVLRPLVRQTTLEALEQTVDDALGRCDIVQLLRTQGEAGKAQGMSDLLLHYIVDEHDSKKAHYNFASYKIAAKVASKQDQALREHISALVRVSDDIGGARKYFGVLVGRLFENLAAQALHLGGKFEVKKAGKTKPWLVGNPTLKLTKGNFREIHQRKQDLEDGLIAAGIGKPTEAHNPQAIQGQFCMPVAANFAAVDAIHLMPERKKKAYVRFFQMKHVTAAGANEVKEHRLNELLQLVPKTTPSGAEVICELYQVIPEGHWDQTQPLKFVDQNKTEVTRPARIVEWLLKMPAQRL